MNFIISETEEEWLSQINAWIETKKTLVGQPISMFLPAGSTPVALYRNWVSRRPDFLKDLTFVQLDEVVTGSQKGCFRRFFGEHLKGYCDQFVPFSSDGPLPQLALLGLGLNGHVAFHEPGISHEMNWGCVKLSEETKGNLGIQEENAWGETVGLGIFHKVPHKALLVRGRSKRAVVERLKRRDPALPASHLPGELQVFAFDVF